MERASESESAAETAHDRFNAGVANVSMRGDSRKYSIHGLNVSCFDEHDSSPPFLLAFAE